MLRSFGISLLLLGLLAASFDGFRGRERNRTTSPTSGTTTEQNGSVHTAEGGVPIIIR